MLDRFPYVAVALVCAALGFYLAVRSGDEARLGRANADVLENRHAAALVELDGLERETGRAAGLRGYAYLGMRQLRRSRAAFGAAVRHEPNNWVLRRDYAIVLLRLGDRAHAKAQMRRSRALNPRIQLPPGFRAAK